VSVLPGEKNRPSNVLKKWITRLFFWIPACLEGSFSRWRANAAGQFRYTFVVISEAGWHSALEELSPDDYLSKPFYLPDLLEMMNNFFPAPAAPEASPVSGETGSNPPGFQMSPARPSISRVLRWVFCPGRPHHAQRPVVGLCRAIAAICHP